MSGDKEGKIQTAIKELLLRHPKVAFAFVTHTGLFRPRVGRGMISMGIPGLPDICGMTKDGRFLAIEIKEIGETPSPIQHEFLDYIYRSGGVSGWADSVEKAELILKTQL